MVRATRKRDGYVLLLTLALIALATISLAGLARHSLALAAHAREQAEDLQHRWGLLSARHVLLERAEQILDSQVSHEQTNAPPWPKPAHLSESFVLGGQTITVVLADEDAKADVNTLQSRKRERTISAIRLLSGEADLAICLRPNADGKAAFATWGQVFDLASTESPAAGPAELSEASADLTCWGSGQLNVCRADDATLREIASLVLPAQKVGELVDQRKYWGGENVDELLDDLELRRPQYLAARRLLGTESRSHSLWITVNDGHREWWYLCVDDGKRQCFAW